MVKKTDLSDVIIFELLDHDSDGEQEIVLSLGSPFRGFAIVNSSSGGLSITKKIRPDKLLVGSGLLYIASLDYDYDGYDDIIAFSPDGNIIKAQPFTILEEFLILVI